MKIKQTRIFRNHRRWRCRCGGGRRHPFLRFLRFPENREEDGQVLFIGDNIAVADTQYGKVRGYKLRGIYYFLGIPYGADTSGANRFMPPRKPKPWTDVYPAIWWGNTAPQKYGETGMPANMRRSGITGIMTT